MTLAPRWDRGTVLAVATVIVALAVATVAIAVVEWLGVADASPLYLLAVVIVAGRYGTAPALATSAVAFFVYDFLFTTPRFTLQVADPEEWVSLVLFLFTAVAIGRMAALLRERADEADLRVREGMSLVTISRAIAMATSFEIAARDVAERLREDTEMRALRIVTRDADGERTVAQAGTVDRDGASAPWTLMRDPTTGGSDWVRIVPTVDGVEATGVEATGTKAVAEPTVAFVVPIDLGGPEVGEIRAFRDVSDPVPGRGARRILALTADQLGVALLRDRLRADLTAAEVARQSDALRAAILDSVSHDLRTPIAAIRALAGTLADPVIDAGPDGQRRAAASIDQEAERLAALVGSLLDMSRIQAGALRPSPEPFEVADLVDTALRRFPPADGARVLRGIPADLPPVFVDPVLFDVALGNILDNAIRYAPAPAEVRVTATPALDARVELTVDDGGPGVPDEALAQLFDRFFRLGRDAGPSRPGLGIGLAVARGFSQAMGVAIEADHSELGGLRIRLLIPAAAAEVATPAGTPR